jgi:hypothetical protein
MNGLYLLFALSPLAGPSPSPPAADVAATSAAPGIGIGSRPATTEVGKGHRRALTFFLEGIRVHAKAELVVAVGRLSMR